MSIEMKNRPRNISLLRRLKCAQRHISEAYLLHKSEGSTWRAKRQIEDAYEDLDIAKKILSRMEKSEIIAQTSEVK